MFKRILVISLFIFFVFFSTYFIANFTYSKEPEQKKIDYNLPYPGILPDNPLYPIKNLRDGLLIFFSRDKIKKTELYLLLSDKKIYMSSMLVKAEKWKLAIITAQEAEELFLKISPLLSSSKKQGISPGEDLIKRLKLSNFKHREIINELLKKATKERKEELKSVLKLNEAILKTLSKL